MIQDRTFFLSCSLVLLSVCVSFGYLRSDLNRDNRVDLEDFLILSEEWLRQDMSYSYYTVLLNHFDSDLSDEMERHEVIDQNDDLTFSEDIKSLGTHSLHIPAGSSVVIPNSEDFLLYRDFTIESFFCYTTYGMFHSLYRQRNDDDNLIAFFYYNISSSSDIFGFQIRSGEGNYVSIGTSAFVLSVSKDTFHHAAITRSKGLLKLWLDGVVVASEQTFGGCPSLTSDASIGFTLEGELYVDEFRILNGEAIDFESVGVPMIPYTVPLLEYSPFLKDVLVGQYGQSIQSFGTVKESNTIGPRKT